MAREEKKSSIKSEIDQILAQSGEYTDIGKRALEWARRKVDSDSDEEMDNKTRAKQQQKLLDMPKLERISKRTLSSEQKEYVRRVLNGELLCLLAEGGYGKTYVAQELADIVVEQTKNKKEPEIYLTSTTGKGTIALVEGTNHTALTLHSWMGLGVFNDEPVENLVRRVFATSGIRLGRMARKRWATCKYLVIDEISMLDPRILEVLHEVACAVRKNRKPFGGIILAPLGDFAQLKPVKSTCSVQFVFQHPLWKEFGIKPFQLTIPFRFDDPRWSEMLSRIRLGKETKADYKLLKTRLVDDDEELTEEKLQEYEAKIASQSVSLFGQKIDVSPKLAQKARERKVLREIKTPYDPVPDVFEFVVPELHSTNEMVNFINERERKLTQPRDDMYVKFEYTSDEVGRNQYNSSTMDAWLNNQRKENLAREKLSIFTGCQVMLTANIETKKGLVNGTLGIIVGWGKIGEKKPGCSTTEIYPIVRFENGVVTTVGRYEWKYNMSDDDGQITYCQIPLMSSYAISYHKAQGMTMKRARMDLGEKIFTCGQAYVGLSRVKTLEGVELLDIKRSSIFADEAVVEFYENLKHNK